MIYRFSIIARCGDYEGWAHNHNEMLDKFEKKKGHRKAFVFLYGEEPNYLEYEYLEKLSDNGFPLNTNMGKTMQLRLQSIDNQMLGDITVLVHNHEGNDHTKVDNANEVTGAAKEV